ncbi:MAG TPA: GNAT family N-acetyltransferase [Candidatus Pacearchaeota archaeon]|nr:GNAT family N-acetyltransferase [Candidatus Pacearchaeota archaeon]
MKIVKAKEEDIQNLIELMIDADNRNKEWAEDRANKFVLNKNQDKLILLARENNKLIGYLGIKKYEDNPAKKFTKLDNYAWITWIAILPKYRGKGIGSILLNSADKYIKKFDKKGVLLDCKEKLISFYNKNGYIMLGKYEDKGALRYVMEKKLK